MYDVPTTLSPSRVEKFTSCPMAFRFASIEKLPEPPTIHTTRGSLVHRALELAFTHPAAARTPELFRACLATANDEFDELPEIGDLGLDDQQRTTLRSECASLVERYLQMEDPTAIHPIGLEVRLSAPIDTLRLQGIIDRLELRDGQLVVTDYKTGRAPSANWEQKSLAGVHFYSFLCEEVFGQRPAAIRLMYLKTGETIEATPNDRSINFLRTRTTAVWRAIEKACRDDDFRPRQSALCSSCTFQSWCPSFGGDPARAAVELGVALSPALAAS
ncbi:MAG: RecB family exonuclease [Desertimonas sp.]